MSKAAASFGQFIGIRDNVKELAKQTQQAAPVAAAADPAGADAARGSQLDTRQGSGAFRNAKDAIAEEEGLRKQLGQAKGIGGFARKLLLGE